MVTKEARIEAVKLMIARGWSPPAPPEHVADRLLDDITHSDHRARIKLTDAELQAVRFAAEGYTEKESAAIVGISYESMRKQTKRARRKLGARSMPHAVGICYRDGLLRL